MAYDSYSTGTYGTYSKGSVGNPSPPLHQEAKNPDGFWCDIQSWNRAVDAGLDPRVKGTNLDFNQKTVNEIYDSMYASSDTDKPQEGTKGFGFMSSGSASTEDPTHMIYYEYEKGGSIKVWDPGVGSTVRQYSLDVNDPTVGRCTWNALPLAK